MKYDHFVSIRLCKKFKFLTRTSIVQEHILLPKAPRTLKIPNPQLLCHTLEPQPLLSPKAPISSLFPPSSLCTYFSSSASQSYKSPPQIDVDHRVSHRALTTRPTGSLWCSHLSDSRFARLPASSLLPSSLTVAAAGHQPVVVHFPQRSSLSALVRD